MLCEVHVEPLAPGRLSVPDCMADKRSADPFPLMLTDDLGVEEKGMITSVPCHVDKADQAAVRFGEQSPSQGCGAGSDPTSLPQPGRHVL